MRGFKNLFDCTVTFGPFTCIAGANGAGKSNLFDAIMFLRDLADCPIVEAASRVRDRAGQRHGDLKSLFTAGIPEKPLEMEFDAEIIVPRLVHDDFGRSAMPTMRHLRYRLKLRYLPQETSSTERIELVHESLTYVQRRQSKNRIGFDASSDFLSSAVAGARRADFISTEEAHGQTVVKLRQDGSGGRALEVPAASSPRTVLGSINTDDKPTALAARREMQSWTFLQLEPSRLRRPDEFSDPQTIASDGGHMPGTLERLGAYVNVANKLSGLLPEVTKVIVDVDPGRRLKTLQVVNRDGISHSARSLSDGTLRFLALAILSEDRQTSGVMCLEEPENGIHPSRIPAMLRLLKDIAVDPSEAVSSDNPLRQIIINTHSPVVVQNLRMADLVVCAPYKQFGTTLSSFSALEGTWRTKGPDDLRMPAVPLGTLLSYLNDEGEHEHESSSEKMTIREYMWEQGLLELGRSHE